ncbi:MAG: serine hydrolase [Janthinobacterium lividum]
MVRSMMAKQGVPGIALAVVQGQRVLHLQGYGVRVAGLPQEVDADTVFQLASVSKALASTVLAASLNDPAAWDLRIATLDSGFTLASPSVTQSLTLRDLMSHRSGLPTGGGDELEGLGYRREEILRRMRYLQLAPFRQQYNYSNFGLSEAAYAMAGSLGLEWETMSEQLLYQPLGMHSTSSRHADFLAALNRASGHVLVNGAFQPLYQRNADAQTPAGGVSSSVRDLSSWLRLQLGHGQFEGRQLIDADVLAATWQPVIRTGAPSAAGTEDFYGIGWHTTQDSQGNRLLSHYGAFTSGASTAVIMAPERQLALVVLTNTAPIGVAEALSSSFMELALTGQVSRDWLAFHQKLFQDYIAAHTSSERDYSIKPQPGAPALPLASYAGVYHNDFYGPVRIAIGQGALQLTIGPRNIVMQMTHWDGDTFIATTPDPDINDGGAAVFSIGPQQRAVRLRLENYDLKGEGDFVRVD